jgi:hypothetical protein
MNEKQKSTDDDLLERNLPPLVEDEEAGDVDALLEDFIEKQRDDGMSWLDDQIGIEDYDDATIAREIGADKEDQEFAWTDGSEGDELLEGAESELVEGEEYGWTDDSDEPSADGWDDGLELAEEGAASVLDDAGEEGVEGDDFSIDTSAWSELMPSTEEAADLGEGVDESDESFGLVFGLSDEQEQRSGGALLPPLMDAALLKGAWLGPEGAETVGVMFHQSTLYAVGPGLAVADAERLTPTGPSELLETLEPTTVIADPQGGKDCLVGTAWGGLLRCTAATDTIGRLNSWAKDLTDAGTPSRPSVGVRVARNLHTDGRPATIWLVTTAGHLLSSADAGQSWTRHLPQVHWQAVATEMQGPAVAALGTEGATTAVYWSADGAAFQRRPLPPQLTPTVRRVFEPQLAVSDSLVLLGGEELEQGLLRSSAPDQPWELEPECPRATALAVATTAQGPLLLAGLFFPGRGLGTLVRRPLEQASWQRVCNVNRLERLFSLAKVDDDENVAKIQQLAVNQDQPNQVALATGYGAFVVEMKDV